ncbi:MAG: hypothetical protein Tsb002_05720 [Wenzhouxiangellaceae bacterium]
MSLRVCFDLDEDDLKHLHLVMKQAQEAAQTKGEDEIITLCKQLLGDVSKTKSPSFIRERMEKLKQMVEMMEDSAWSLPEPERNHVVNALAYFANPEDLIPDHVPSLGFLDDAILIELIARDLKPELDAYRDFIAFRATEAKRRGMEIEAVGREEWLASQRQQLISRMRRRRRARGGGSSGGGGRQAFSLW